MHASSTVAERNGRVLCVEMQVGKCCFSATVWVGRVCSYRWQVPSVQKEDPAGRKGSSMCGIGVSVPLHGLLGCCASLFL